MPARARTSGLARVRSRPSNTMRPARGRNSPMMLLSSVVLPTPLRPIRHTTCPACTSRLTSRRISVSPYDTDRFSICIIDFAILSQIDFDHLGIALYLAHGALAENLALVQHRHRHGNLPDERHVVVDDEQGVFLGHGHEQFAGAFGLARAHAGDGLVDEQQL